MNSFEAPLLPPATIGIVGGGQLGQMIGSAAVAMGFRVAILDPTPQCPAAAVAHEHIIADYDDAAALERLAQVSDVLTYEFENVDPEALDRAGRYSAFPQGTRALRICRNRVREKDFLRQIGVPVADYQAVSDIERDCADFGLPLVVKTAEGGYDGKGQVVVDSAERLGAAKQLCLSAPCIMERLISFQLEFSVIVAGNPQGQYVVFPLAANEHRDGILYRSTVPAEVPASVAKRAEEIAILIAGELNLVGVMGIEMFLDGDGRVLVNELAPRPHNSGHYTIEGASLSQFEAHVRGVCAWPLPQPHLIAPTVMTNILGEDLPEALAATSRHPQWHFHFYGKEVPHPQRKMGHITVVSDRATRGEQ